MDEESIGLCGKFLCFELRDESVSEIVTFRKGLFGTDGDRFAPWVRDLLADVIGSMKVGD